MNEIFYCFVYVIYILSTNVEYTMFYVEPHAF